MNNYTDRFLEAMKVVSNKKQVAADYDKTIRAQIAGVPTEDKKYYTIQYNDLQYKVRTWYEEYVVGDVVYVRVIGSKMDGDKIIEGKVAPILQDRNSTSMVEIPMSKKWVLSEMTYIDSEEQEIYKNDSVNSEYFNGSLNQNCLRITCEFNTGVNPENINFLTDYYGIKINLTNGREYSFTCKDFMGNPYTAEMTYQTYDIYFNEPIKEPGIWIENIVPIRNGFYANQEIILSNLTSQFITVKSYSEEEWTMTYSTDTGYVQNNSNSTIIIKSRLFNRGKELFEKDLEENQKVIIERLSPEFKWERFEIVAPGTDYDFTNINFNEYYIRYKFIEQINQEERVLASSDIIKIQNKTLPSNNYTIDQVDNYATETTGLYLGSDFKLIGSGSSGYWGYGSLEKYESYFPVQGKLIDEDKGEYETFSGFELSYRQIFSNISSLPDAMVMSYVKEGNNYYLIKKIYTPPTADEQARQLTTSMHLFPKNVIVKYDADGILGSNNQVYKITPNSSFFPANEEKIQKLEWVYKVNNLYVYYDGNNNVEEDDKGTTVTGIYTWVWEKDLNNENIFKWVNKGFVFSYEETLEEGKNIIAPDTAKGNLFASFSQGVNGELQFTAVNKYNKYSAGFNNLTFSIMYEDGARVDYPFEVNFLADGNLGTNGTKYALIIEDFWRDMTTPYITSRDWNGLYLRAQLFNTETNQIVPDSAIQWNWAPNFVDRLYWEPNGNSSEIQYLFNKTTEKEELEKNFKSSVLDFSKFYTANSEGNKFYTYYLANSVTKINNKVTDHQDFSSASLEELSVNYVELTAEYDGSTITSTYTIPITSHLNTPNEYTDYVSKITLPESDIQYSSDHSFIIGNSSDSIKVYVSSSNINNIESIGFMPAGNWKRYCELSTSYIISDEESGMEYNLSKIKDDNNNSLIKEGDTVIGGQLNIKYKTLNADLTALIENNYDYFGLYIVYNYEKVNESVPSQRIIGKTFSISCNRYFNSMINDWDGKSKLIEDAVLTPQVIAGSKIDDKFNGAMIGRVDDKPNGPGGTTRTRYGLFGYGKGVETFGIDSSTGDAHFEGDITARSLTLLPEVAGSAGLESGIARGRKKGIVTRQFSDYWKDSTSNQDEKELVTENLIVGYIYSHPDANTKQPLEPFKNEVVDSDKKPIGLKHSGKPQNSYLIELPGVEKYTPKGETEKKFPCGFQFMLNSSTKKRIVGSPSKKLLFSFVAKIPIEAEVRFITSNVGGNSEDGRITWLTPRQGTGKFEEYRIFVQCGSEPSDQKKNYEYGIEENIGTENIKQFGTTGYFILTDHSQAVLDKEKLKEEYKDMQDPSKYGYWLLASAECYEIFDDNLTEAEDLVGNFAGWQIKKDSLSYKENETANYLHSFIQPATTSKTAYTVGNGEDKTDWAMYFGGSSDKVGNFGVDQSGKLFATDADISGTIHATSLTLGDGDSKQSIDSYIETKIPTLSGQQLEVTTDINTYNGKTYYQIKDPSGTIAGNMFSIASDGALYAQNAVIKGTLISGSVVTGEIRGATGHVSSEFAFGTNKSLKVSERSENPSGNGAPYSGILSHDTKNSSLILGESAAFLEYDGGENGVSSIAIDESINISAISSLTLGGIGFQLNTSKGRTDIVSDGIMIETTNQDSGIRLNAIGYGKVSISGQTGINLLSSDGSISMTTALSDSINLTTGFGKLKGTWTLNNSSIATTSDKTKKNTITKISSQYSELFDALNPVTYKYNDGTSDRLHTGFIAQDVKKALDKVKIDTKDFAALVVNNQGTEDESWYLRYEEFIALNTWQIQKVKARISELETRVSQLEELLQANSK